MAHAAELFVYAHSVQKPRAKATQAAKPRAPSPPPPPPLLRGGGRGDRPPPRYDPDLFARRGPLSASPPSARAAPPLVAMAQAQA